MTKKQLDQVIEWFIDAGVTDLISDSRPTYKKSAKDITTLAQLKESILKIDIPLKDCAINMVFGVGNERAEILLLGEAPGAEEDKQGIPFVGQSGQLLDKMLAAIELDRTKVYITNILPWRPPGNRTPTNQEIEMFRPYVLKHISLINPKVVVCLGGTAAKALLKTSQGIVQLRGKWINIEEVSAKIIPTFHPAYLLRAPSQKREAWQDFLNIKEAISALI
ncbi:MAG: uracil-DNA glycosylase [Holosporaceae bacterium]|jgi:DNA polymerase|nr:uracil-DNA glycosylase [Holosporaceae bacterium]